MKTCLALLTVLLVGTAAQAGVSIAPGSRNAGQLRPSSMELDVNVNPAAGLARVVSTSVFANQSSVDFEGEFMAEAPDNSIITQFSYWYRGQKTLARIVENYRAARIYQEATSPYQPRPRDPALVEMIARNKFRVRVAPIDAQKPLKIEIVWWQPLQKVGNQWRLTLPWRDSQRAFALERVDLKVRFTTPVQNIQSPFTEAKTTPRSLEYAKAGGDAPEDSLLTFESVEKPVMLQSRSKGDGYFVAIIPDSAWKDYESWKAFHSVHAPSLGDGRRIVAGRYSQVSPAKALGYGLQSNTEASEKWWASLELDDMARRSNRYDVGGRGVELSKRYGLPSAWTSWLAIPDSERAKLADIIDQEKIQRAYYERAQLASALAEWKRKGKTNTPQYRAMRADFEAKNKLALRNKSWTPEERTLNDFFVAFARNQLQSYRNDDVQAAQRDRQEVLNLLKGVPRNDDLKKVANEHVAQAVKTRQGKLLAKQSLKSVLAGTPTARFEAPIRRSGSSQYSGDYWPEISEIAKKAVETRQAQPQVSHQLEQLLELWLKATNPAPDLQQQRDGYLTGAETQIYGGQIAQLRTALGQEIAAKHEDGPRYAQLRSELNELIRKSGLRFQSTEPELSQQLREAQQTLYKLQNAAQLDEAAVASAQAELKRLRSFLNEETQRRIARGEAEINEYDGYGGRNYIAEQWALAAKQGGADSPDALRLKKALEKQVEAYYNKIHRPVEGRNYEEGVKPVLREAERNRLWKEMAPLYDQLTNEQSKPQLDAAKISAIQEQLDALQDASVYNQVASNGRIKPQYDYGLVYNKVLGNLDAELNKPLPDAQVVAGLTDRLAEQIPNYDPVYRKYWTGSDQNELRGTKQDYARLRVQRIGARFKAQQAAAKLQVNPPAAEQRALQREIAQWKQVDNQLRVRMGDPLIAVAAPQNARQVLAIFPSGEIKKLEWNDAHKRWEARFDVPTWANEGDYAVQIVVVFANGKRQKLTMHFAVDVQAPSGIAQLQNEGEKWNLSLESDEQTDRVTAFLPWRERVELRRDEQGVFAAQVFVPQEFRGQKSEVRFVLTDKAHNRTEIVVDWQ